MESIATFANLKLNRDAKGVKTFRGKFSGEIANYINAIKSENNPTVDNVRNSRVTS